MKKLILLIIVTITTNTLAQNTFPSSGNVGIGTTSPNAKLTVEGNIRAGYFSFNNGGYDDSNGNITKIIDHTKYNNYILGWDWTSGLGDHTLIGWGGLGEGDELIISESKGLLWPNNVGIGTMNPDAKLAVNGKIHTKEIKVDMTGWPDYVFKKDYSLITLKEVESHIKEKGYLPGIPSAKEAENKGIELGYISKKLLQKIEELTLYVIYQEKKIKNQQTQLLEEKEKHLLLEERLQKIEKLLIKKKNE